MGMHVAGVHPTGMHVTGMHDGPWACARRN